MPKILHGDCLEVLKGMETGSVDLVFCSPPYEDARLYGELQYKVKGQDWVDWCIPRFEECLRVSKGLVAWVIEGKTRNFQWTATPALLMADLHRRGVKLRKPPIYHRVGIPGSGGPEWLRNDYEFIVCASHGRLPWADNTAMGEPPKYGVGGNPTHQTAKGRIDGERAYKAPEKANPGNVISLNSSFIDEVLIPYALSECKDPREVLRELREAITAQSLPQWFARVYDRVQSTQILRSTMQGTGAETTERTQTRGIASPGSQDRTQSNQTGNLCDVRDDGKTGSSSHRRRCDQQPTDQSTSSLPTVPSPSTQEHLLLRRRMRETVQGERLLQSALFQMETVWRSFTAGVGACDFVASNVVHCKVGGGHMGSPLAASNEAPFPESLAEFFIRSFCPPGGIVLDPFSGSGTTVAVALKTGREGIGVDIRQSQIDLTTRRIQEVQENA